MTVVVGTAGHIDHGKTTLLRALTGIDADRLPEEKARGLTVDVGYAHFVLDDGSELDFVDVPGHDRLVGNMLVGAGEVDACLLVVAADDGPRAQTLEHLALIDALGIRHGLAVVTKADLVDGERLAAVTARVGELMGATSLAGSPVLAASAVTGNGLPELRASLGTLSASAAIEAIRRRDLHSGAWLAIDRVFSIRGRGVVVTASSRGAPVARGDALLVLPGQLQVRAREIQVHDRTVERGPDGGRVALNLSGVDRSDLRRGQVLVGRADADGPSMATASDRLLVALRRPTALSARAQGDPWPPGDGDLVRLHVGTDQADALVVRSSRDGLTLADGRALATLRLDRPVAAAPGERFVLRRPPPAGLLAGGVVLDAAPAHGPSRRRQTVQRVSRLADAVAAADPAGIIDARLALHGLSHGPSGVALAPDIREAAQAEARGAVAAFHGAHADRTGMAIADLRTKVADFVGRRVTASRQDMAEAADLVIDDVLQAGDLLRDADVVQAAGHAPPPPDPALMLAADRLVHALDTPAPPSLRSAAAEAGCPPEAIRTLERSGRIVVLEDDLAWSREAYDRLAASALAMARTAPLTPAALRDSTGTSRKYVMALLEDLDRRGILSRTPTGHVPGPRA